jgi:lipoate-protein ligase A
MACDHALAESVSRGEPPALRFYAWEPATVSIGYNQPVRGRRERFEELRARGFGAVRRPTGGRAVLHAREVTYSVAASANLPVLAGGLRASCARVHAAIRSGLAALGIADLSLHGTGGQPRDSSRSSAEGPDLEAGPRRALACFATPSRSEIAWRGRKLVGSAQRRFEGAILQHGSILVEGSQSALEELWPGGSGGGWVATLVEAGGRPFAFDEVARAVREGFESELGVAFEPGQLDAWEEARAQCLAAERYGRDEFLYRS